MKTLRGLYPYLKGSKALAVLSVVFATISVVSKMAIPYVVGLAIDQLRLGNYDLAPYLITIAGLIVSGVCFRYLFDLSIARIGQKTVMGMRNDLFHSLNQVPLSYLDQHEEGDLLLRLVNDIENVQTGLIAGAGALYEGVVQILVTLGFLFYVHWLLALAVVLLTPLSIVVSRFVSRANSKYFKAQNRSLGQLTAFSLESLDNWETSHGYGKQEQSEALFDKKNEETRSSTFKATFASAWINPSTRLLNNLIYAVLVILGAYFLAKELSFGIAFTIGGLSAFLSYAFQYMTPFNEISNVASEVLYATASFARIQETILAPKDIDEGTKPLGDSIDSLEAKEIDFSYDGKRSIISSWSIDVYKGHKIALVGPTGCGKTTIINLLMRFYDPQKGAFYANGISTLETPKKELRSHIGMVLQQTWLRHGTIAENIAFARPEATREEIQEAARKAHAEEFILRLPQGYDTVISKDRGLSTGEEQLLCVARILLAKPEIVLLDEATSNIDLRTELALSDAFDELMKGKTSLVVAHRLSTIENADLILVMKDGKIIEQGNFAELLKKNGFFAELYNAQLA